MPHVATPVTDPATGRLVDIRLTVQGKIRHLCGRQGETRLAEAARLATLAGDALIFIGFGLGTAPALALALGAPRVVVVDRESGILALALPASGLADDPRLVLVDDPDPGIAAETALAAVADAPFPRVTIIEHPAYARLDPLHYPETARRIRAAALFRQRTGYRKFTAPKPRALLFAGDYFLVREIAEALTGLDVPLRTLPLPDLERGQTGFVEDLLAAVAAFQPDFVLTVNHLGLDREGRLMGLLADLELPLASWFVDNPHLILHDFPRQVSPWCQVFTWDADTVQSLAAMGFTTPAFLPLATDAARFRPPKPDDPPPDPSWPAACSFVGNSMIHQVREPLSRLAAFPELTRDYARLAADFARHDTRNVRDFLARKHPATLETYLALPASHDRLAFELLITWEATRQYRVQCVSGILPFSPVIAGDRHWAETFPDPSPPWRLLPPLGYYQDLPRFYPRTDVSLNCTSMQMKGAINQRVFDVPACGGFVLTDRREQLHIAFTPDETACYDHPDEIPSLVRHYLNHPTQRLAITTKARTRILAEHTYRHRLSTLIDVLRRRYGG
ncbi:CgeB family protein [Desulfolutivibrio sulfoxidireducens]|uniref:CgeB family protein n=1 Tax=Desulfolutivibrio sulfoxidireducens TaxID=2773299 RepID=UPI00159DA910|nr:glycosyltransferase [Desulfolutivibrio sulfoxidireducens]QLA17919.1 glycosyltransferase [Desulfolutivibrio sulfoxidireducens]QLA21722.1 glycosyltransferase [Desulfolutivibrio sulfoxidireducens]